MSLSATELRHRMLLLLLPLLLLPLLLLPLLPLLLRGGSGECGERTERARTHVYMHVRFPCACLLPLERLRLFQSRPGRGIPLRRRGWWQGMASAR